VVEQLAVNAWWSGILRVAVHTSVGLSVVNGTCVGVGERDSGWVLRVVYEMACMLNVVIDHPHSQSHTATTTATATAAVKRFVE